MQHPHSTQVQKVIDALVRAKPMAKLEKHLDMTEARINDRGHVCGTVHCHAGWFVVGTGLHEKQDVDFQDGMLLMAETLGFYSHHELRSWANANDSIWGNNDAGGMFTRRSAFFSPSRPNGAENLQDIIDHWKEVKARLEALEQPLYPNISKELAHQGMNTGDTVDNPVKEIVNN